MNPDEWFDLIERRAPGLRAAGVRSVSLENVVIHLAPSDPVSAVDDDSAPGDAPTSTGALNALDDPATFGGQLPGWKIPVSSEPFDPFGGEL